MNSNDPPFPPRTQPKLALLSITMETFAPDGTPLTTKTFCTGRDAKHALSDWAEANPGLFAIMREYEVVTPSQKPQAKRWNGGKDYGD